MVFFSAAATAPRSPELKKNRDAQSIPVHGQTAETTVVKSKLRRHGRTDSSQFSLVQPEELRESVKKKEALASSHLQLLQL